MRNTDDTAREVFDKVSVAAELTLFEAVPVQREQQPGHEDALGLGVVQADEGVGLGGHQHGPVAAVAEPQRDFHAFHADPVEPAAYGRHRVPRHVRQDGPLLVPRPCGDGRGGRAGHTRPCC